MRYNRILSIILTCFAIFLLVGSKITAEEISLPRPVGDIYIQDFAGLLTKQEKMELRKIGRTIEDLTTAQIAVLTIDSIGDTTIEQFANEALRQYGIGNVNEDNGVLLVIGMTPAPGMTERPLKIEVGYGLEGILPDGKIGRILDQITVPYLMNNQPNLAIFETYKVLADEVVAGYGFESGQYQSEQPVQSTSADTGIGIPPWLLIIIVGIVLFLDFKYFGGILTHILLSILSRGGRGGGDGGFRGGGGGSSGGGGASRGW